MFLHFVYTFRSLSSKILNRILLYAYPNNEKYIFLVKKNFLSMNQKLLPTINLASHPHTLSLRSNCVVSAMWGIYNCGQNRYV